MKKKLMILFSLALIGAFSYAQINKRTGEENSDDNNNQESNSDIDQTLEGPNGETIHIGVNGGRYFFRNGRKIYVTKRMIH